MASIKISELPSTGSELFQDSESFLNELTDREMFGIAGGRNNSLGNSRNANSVGNNNSVNNNTYNNSANGSYKIFGC